MVDWTEKYRPTTLSEVRGNNKARDQLREWAETWENHGDAVILHGSPGVGKTSAAHALANDMGWPTIELNASDQRTGDVVKRIAGEAAKSGTLTGGVSGRRIVIMDEADNLTHNADRGGSRAITDVVKSANQPLVLIANEFYDMSNSLRNACETIEFRDVSARSIVPALRDICRQEDIEYDDDALDAIAQNDSGDLRSAVNDLQAVATTGGRLMREDVVTGERDTTSGIFDFLDDLIKKQDAEGALKASYDVDETPDNMLNWIEDNLPKDYEGQELADAYGYMANADRWLGRVRATQNYKYWRYAGDNMTAGVAVARNGKKGGWTRYGPPSYWRKLGSSRGKRDTRDYIARKIAEESGISMSTARREVIPFLSEMTHHCKNRELTVTMAARYDLEEKHVSFITGSGKTTNKVEKIVADAEERKHELAIEHSGGAFEGFASDSVSDDAESVQGDGDEDAKGDGSDPEPQESAAEPEPTDAPESGDGQSGLGDFL
ncbi:MULTISPECIES: replication factor C large subunit [unclassified Haladaptatus]|uniref:replication factor C large subunit n=1 Tax=unclassified Haladaptatus TaxID=2622732 RepID=UPI00209C43C7|nr:MULTISPECIES: replication factor C large subunit [unclassified Haladaptatus]MCO8244986.1 replication factor C large subunit [Haladaptatus sp. AB643]MCO8253129.1 replication factor C large subunit [Haladaptatus sp. AB618]